MRPRSILLFTLLAATLAPCATAQTMRSKLSQFGITWTFDKAYPTGQFANGDWWVRGPVKIIEITPKSTSGGRHMNGSMINPSPKLKVKQGYDSAMKSNVYDKSLNVALDIAKDNPLRVPTNSSLVSTISRSQAAVRPQVDIAAILTVLSRNAPAGSFRPPYCGTTKTIQFNAKQLDYSKLLRLAPTAKAPTLATVEGYFERPWIDHSPGWTGREQHPKKNMPDYGRDMSVAVGIGALTLHLDYSDSKKRTLLTRFVQLGIDFQGIIDDGGHRNWMNNGGHASGRKWPIMFAGLMLGDKRMTNIASQDVWFGEDMQTFIVRETSKGVYNYGHGGYTKADVGMAEYGIRHQTEPKLDDKKWNASYRTCCTGNSWVGFVLAARLMDAQKLWKNDALFAYVDRYIEWGRQRKAPEWELSFHPFPLSMWDRYRHRAPRFKLRVTNRRASAAKKPAGIHTKTPPREIRLTWPATKSARSYRVYRGETATNLAPLSNRVTRLRFTDPEVPAGKTYYYVISAHDSTGKELSRSEVARVDT